MAIRTIDTFRRIRDEQHEQTKNLTPEQRRDFFRKRAEEAAMKARALRRKSKP